MRFNSIFFKTVSSSFFGKKKYREQGVLILNPDSRYKFCSFQSQNSPDSYRVELTNFNQNVLRVNL